jgi:hypothetical protein
MPRRGRDPWSMGKSTKFPHVVETKGSGNATKTGVWRCLEGLCEASPPPTVRGVRGPTQSRPLGQGPVKNGNIRWIPCRCFQNMTSPLAKARARELVGYLQVCMCAASASARSSAACTSSAFCVRVSHDHRASSSPSTSCLPPSDLAMNGLGAVGAGQRE